MDLKRVAIDAVHEKIIMTISPADYADLVSKKLKEIAPTVSIKGFRKGLVPFSMVEKMYKHSVKSDILSKMIDTELDKFIKDEKINLLTRPLATMDETFNWDADELVLEFEVGFAPEFTIDLSAKNKIVKYEIETSETMIDEQIENMKRQYGKIVTLDVVDENSLIDGQLVNTKDSSDVLVGKFNLSDANYDKVKVVLLGKKVGDVVTLPIKEYFAKDNIFVQIHIETHPDFLEQTYDFTIEKIEVIEKAELNQEFFDKMFGKDAVKSDEDMRNLIKKETEKHFNMQTELKYVDEVNNFLLENTKMTLPESFLKKVIAKDSKDGISNEDLEKEYEKYEIYFKKQLIEEKILSDNGIEVKMEELHDYISTFYRAEMSRYGVTPSEDELQQYSFKLLSDEKTRRDITDRVVSDKIKGLFNEKVNCTVKKMTVEEYLKETDKAI